MFHNMMDLADLLDKSRDFEPQIRPSIFVRFRCSFSYSESNYVQFKRPKKKLVMRLNACLNTWP